MKTSLHLGPAVELIDEDPAQPAQVSELLAQEVIDAVDSRLASTRVNDDWGFALGPLNRQQVPLDSVAQSLGEPINRGQACVSS